MVTYSLTVSFRESAATEVIISKTTEIIIYEGEDGEENIYVRSNGQVEMVLVPDFKKQKISKMSKNLRERVQEDQLWHEIRRLSETHPGLKEELDRVVIFYNLLKSNKNPLMWHPV